MIYIAATYENHGDVRVIKRQLMRQGFVVSASWCDGYHEDAPKELCAAHDLTEVMQATTFILDLRWNPQYTPGKMTEYGIALASGCDTIVIGDQSVHNGVFFELADQWLDGWEIDPLTKALASTDEHQYRECIRVNLK